MVPERPLTPLRTPKRLWKKLARKSKDSQAAILESVFKLRVDPNDPSLRTEPLQGRKVGQAQVYEVRVTEGDRLTYYWDGRFIVFENHCTHKQVLGR